MLVTLSIFLRGIHRLLIKMRVSFVLDIEQQTINQGSCSSPVNRCLRNGLSRVLFLLLAFLSGVIYADDQSDSAFYQTEVVPLWLFMSFLEDPDGGLDIRQVINHPDLEELEGHPQMGRSDSKYWFEIDLTGSRFANMPLFMLAIENPALDYIDLYRVSADGEYSMLYRTGDQYPFTDRPYSHRYFQYPINDHKKGDKYFLQVWGYSPIFIPSYIGEQMAVLEKNSLASVFTYAMFGMVFALIAYNLLLYFVTGTQLYGWFVLFVGILWLFTLHSTGIGYQFIWRDYPNVQNIIAYVVVAAFHWVSFNFTRLFLRISLIYPGLNQLLKYAAWLSLVFLLLIPLDQALAFALINMITLLVIVVIPVICTMACLKNVQASGFFLLSWLFVIAMMLIFNVSLLGILPMNFLTLKASELGVVLEAVFLSLTLMYRIRSVQEETVNKEVLARQHAELTSDKTLSKLITERAGNRAKSAFLSRVIDEVKTPAHAFYTNIQLLFNSELNDYQRKELMCAKANAMQFFFYLENLLTYSEVLGDDIVAIESKSHVQSELDEILNSWLEHSRHDISLDIEYDGVAATTAYANWVHVRKVLCMLLDSLESIAFNRTIRILVYSEMIDTKGSAGANASEGKICIAIDHLNVKNLEVLDNWVAEQASASLWEGLGLEYYVGRKLVDTIGAHLFYENHDPNDYKLNFQFPCRLAKDHYAAQARLNFPSIHILIIDCNKGNVQIMRSMLTELGVMVDIASSMQQVTNKIQTGDYDIVLADSLESGLVGPDIAKMIRDIHSSNRYCPIIAVSANTSDKYRDSCLKSGMNDFMPRPVDLNLLAKFLTRWVPEY